MSFEDIMTKVSSIINTTFDASYTITPETSAEEIDEWDSISHIELITAIESDFGVRFALGELQDLKNVGDMAKLIQEKTA